MIISDEGSVNCALSALLSSTKQALVSLVVKAADSAPVLGNKERQRHGLADSRLGEVFARARLAGEARG